MEFLDVFLRFKFILALYGAVARAILLLRQIPKKMTTEGAFL